jgi:hypothetical protein
MQKKSDRWEETEKKKNRKRHWADGVRDSVEGQRESYKRDTGKDRM